MTDIFGHGKLDKVKPVPIPLEATLQSLFWRGAALTLPPSCRCTLEASASDHLAENVSIPDGKIDIWVDHDLAWAIELQRDSDRMEHHKEKITGKYAKLHPKVSRLVDFVVKKPSPPTVTGDYYTAVEIDPADLSGCVVHSGNHKPVSISFVRWKVDVFRSVYSHFPSYTPKEEERIPSPKEKLSSFTVVEQSPTATKAVGSQKKGPTKNVKKGNSSTPRDKNKNRKPKPKKTSKRTPTKKTPTKKTPTKKTSTKR